MVGANWAAGVQDSSVSDDVINQVIERDFASSGLSEQIKNSPGEGENATRKAAYDFIKDELKKPTSDRSKIRSEPRSTDLYSQDDKTPRGRLEAALSGIFRTKFKLEIANTPPPPPRQPVYDKYGDEYNSDDVIIGNRSDPSPPPPDRATLESQDRENTNALETRVKNQVVSFISHLEMSISTIQYMRPKNTPDGQTAR